MFEDSEYPKPPADLPQAVEIAITLAELDSLHQAVLGYAAGGYIGADEAALVDRLEKRLEAALARLHGPAVSCHG